MYPAFLSSEIQAHFWWCIKNPTIPISVCITGSSCNWDSRKTFWDGHSTYKLAQALWRQQIPLATADPSFYGPVLKAGWGFQKNCVCCSPQIPVPGHRALKTGVFFTNSQYFLDGVPQQLFLRYQSHVISWDEFFWFLNTDYLHLDRNDRVLAETLSRQEERGETLPAFVCVTAESVQQPQISPPPQTQVQMAI